MENSKGSGEIALSLGDVLNTETQKQEFQKSMVEDDFDVFTPLKFDQKVKDLAQEEISDQAQITSIATYARNNFNPACKQGYDQISSKNDAKPQEQRAPEGNLKGNKNEEMVREEARSTRKFNTKGAFLIY